MKNMIILESVLHKKHNAINYNSVRDTVAEYIIQVGKEDGETT